MQERCSTGTSGPSGLGPSTTAHVPNRSLASSSSLVLKPRPRASISILSGSRCPQAPSSSLVLPASPRAAVHLRAKTLFCLCEVAEIVLDLSSSSLYILCGSCGSELTDRGFRRHGLEEEDAVTLDPPSRPRGEDAVTLGISTVARFDVAARFAAESAIAVCYI